MPRATSVSVRAPALQGPYGRAHPCCPTVKLSGAYRCSCRVTATAAARTALGRAGGPHRILWVADDLVWKAQPSMLAFIPDGLLWRRKVRVCERADRDAH